MGTGETRPEDAVIARSRRIPEQPPVVDVWQAYAGIANPAIAGIEVDAGVDHRREGSLVVPLGDDRWE